MASGDEVVIVVVVLFLFFSFLRCVVVARVEW